MQHGQSITGSAYAARSLHRLPVVRLTRVHTPSEADEPGGRMGGCPLPFPSVTRPRPTGRCPRRRSATSAGGRSGGTSTCRSARCAAATATSTPTPPRSSATGRQPGDVRRGGDRRDPAGPPGARRRGPAGLDGLPRRRYADAAAARRPDRDPGRAGRGVRARRGRRGHHRVQPGQRHAVGPRRAAVGRLHPDLVRHAVGGPARAGHPGPHPRPAAGARRWSSGRGQPASSRSAST